MFLKGDVMCRNDLERLRSLGNVVFLTAEEGFSNPEVGLNGIDVEYAVVLYAVDPSGGTMVVVWFSEALRNRLTLPDITVLMDRLERCSGCSVTCYCGKRRTRALYGDVPISIGENDLLHFIREFAGAVRGILSTEVIEASEMRDAQSLQYILRAA